MSTTPSERTLAQDADAESSAANTLGLAPGKYVQEIGYDDDVDFDLRDEIEAVIGEEMADEDVDDVFDVVVMWWRSDDPDLFDAIVDAQTTLADGGIIWLLAPKANREGHISPGEITDAAPSAGMHMTKTISAAADWSGFRLEAKKNFS